MYYIGIDLGGTTIKGGIVTEEGVIKNTISIPTFPEREGAEIIKDIASLSKRLIQENSLELKEVKCIGIGSPGLVDSKNKVVVTSSNINFDNINFENEMKKYIDLPIYLENDANCATIAEFVCGSMKGYKNAIMLTVGTGVGGGVIVDSKMCKGAFLGEGELGHMIVDYSSNFTCGCGQKGCLETFSSANSIVAYAKELIKDNEETQILKIAGSIENIDAKAVFDAYDLNDDIATKVIDRFNTYMAIGIVNLVNIFRPDVICIGGGASARGEKLTSPIEKIAENMIYGNSLQTKIVPAMLGNDAGIIGAAMICKV